jgi:hypothetical protein
MRYRSPGAIEKMQIGFACKNHAVFAETTQSSGKLHPFRGNSVVLPISGMLSFLFAIYVQWPVEQSNPFCVLSKKWLQLLSFNRFQNF